MGIEPERLEMFNLSSSEGPWFAAICKEMTDRAYKLGPSPVKREARAAWLAAQQASEASAQGFAYPLERAREQGFYCFQVGHKFHLVPLAQQLKKEREGSKAGRGGARNL